MVLSVLLSSPQFKRKTMEPSTVIFWNIWGHRCPLEIAAYIESRARVTDIFCLTEVTNMGFKYSPVPVIYTGRSESEPPSHPNGRERLVALTRSEFITTYYSPNERSWTCLLTNRTFNKIGFGSALIVRRSINKVAQGHTLICNNRPGINTRVMQWIVYDKDGSRYLVAHLHGLWIAENTKGDHPLRQLQSRTIRQKLSYLTVKFRVEKVVFGGDLNLALDTDALKALTEEGIDQVLARNLILEHKIESTRTPLYRNYDQKGKSQHADYVLTSEKVNIHEFQVQNNVLASDHAPLEVRFS